MELITKKVDDFNKTEILQHKQTLDFRTVNDGTLSFGLRSIKKNESIAILLQLDFSCKTWWFLRNGSIQIKTDDKVIELDKPIASDSDVGSQKEMLTNTTTVLIHEKVHYNLTPEQLKQICDARTLDIRVYGKKGYEDFKIKQKYFGFFKIFYNQAIDPTANTEECDAYLKSSKKRNTLSVIGKVFTAIIAVPIMLINGASRR